MVSALKYAKIFKAHIVFLWSCRERRTLSSFGNYRCSLREGGWG